MQAIADFFNSENFMPHGHCFLWQPDILWLHVVSDACIVLAYFSIPFALILFYPLLIKVFRQHGHLLKRSLCYFPI